VTMKKAVFWDVAPCFSLGRLLIPKNSWHIAVLYVVPGKWNVIRIAAKREITHRALPLFMLFYFVVLVTSASPRRVKDLKESVLSFLSLLFAYVPQRTCQLDVFVRSRHVGWAYLTNVSPNIIWDRRRQNVVTPLLVSFKSIIER
jgi:hypothetical protein